MSDNVSAAFAASSYDSDYASVCRAMLMARALPLR